MLSDEEKQAIEKLDWYFEDSTGLDIAKQTRIILNLIEKQSKEIEHQIEKRANQKKELAILNAKQIEFNKLVNTVNSYKGQFKRQEKEIEELKEDKYGLEEEVQIQAKNLMICEDAIKETYTKWIDKIKAKIEEVDKEEKEALKGTKGQDRYAIKQEYMYKRSVLQSLLEKE